jgi:hypothetical protein
MMATITGTVASIDVLPNSGGTPASTWAKVNVIPKGLTKPEIFVLWSESVAVFTPPAQWIARTSALSLLRDALINKLTVTVTTPTATSAVIERVVV